MANAAAIRDRLSPISPTSLGKYVNLQRCDQFLGWKLLATDLFGPESRFEQSTLSPLFAETGTRFEHEQLAALVEELAVDTVVGPAEENVAGVDFDEHWDDAYEDATGAVLEKVDTVSGPASETTVVLFQPPIRGHIEAWGVAGLADIVVIRTPDDEAAGDVVIEVVEVKSSTEVQTSHRVQAACYSRLLRTALSDSMPSVETTLRGYVVTRRNAVSEFGVHGLEAFELTTVESDVRMLLQPGGRIDRVVFDLDADDEAPGRTDVDVIADSDDEPVDTADPWAMSNRLSRRCAGCDYHDVCYTRAVETDGLELLGIPEGTQEDLEALDIESLADLGALYHFPDRTNPVGYEDDPDDPDADLFKVRDPDRVRTIQNDIGIKDLERLAHAAQVFSREGHYDRRPGNTKFIRQSGFNLPRGEPEAVTGYADYPDRSLIRVYLYAQEDTIRDRLNLLGAYVINYRTGRDRHVSAMTDALPIDTPRKDHVERTLLQDFLVDLVDALETVAPSGLAAELNGDVPASPGFVHLYFYSRAQRDGVMAAAKRHVGGGDGEFEALRTLLGLRTDIQHRDIDQEMVSVLQDEFVTRHLLRFSGFGIVQTVEQFTRPNPDWNSAGSYRGELHDWTFDWEHDIEGELTPIPLQHVFDTGLFENAVPYTRSGDRVRFDLDGGPQVTNLEAYYTEFPFTNRHTDDIPLEYVWGALDELGPDWVDPDSFEDPEDAKRLRQEIQQYRYAGDPGESSRIKPVHLQGLAEKLAEAFEHIEASIPEGHKSAFVPKAPLPLDDLLELQFEDSELALTAREYLDLEHGARERQLRRDWRQPLSYRLTGGRSVAFQCTSPPAGETNRIEGRRWSPSGLDSAATRSESGISEGDWAVMTPVDTTTDPPEELGVQRATDIARMPLVHVARLEDDRIVVDAPWNDWDWPREYHDFMKGHHRFVGRSERPDVDEERVVVDGDDDTEVIVEEGTTFVLDPALDQVVSYHAARALAESDDNHVLQWLDELLTGERTSMETELCEPHLVEGQPGQSFVETEFVEANSVEEAPNDAQRRLIRDTRRHLVVVQGPPGTGKTSYTTSPAVLGRAFAFEREGRDFAACVSALSHDAVDELFDEIRTVAADRRREDVFDNMKIVRVRPSDTPADAVPYDNRSADQLVEHVAYHDEAGEQRLRDICQRFLLDDRSEPSQLLLCGPPTSIRGAVDKMTPAMLDVEDLNRNGDYDPGVWDLLREGDSDLFDLVVVDEASMMDLPLLFLAGAFLDASGQLLLAGDHRQMQPIQAYGWDEEDRETVEEAVPFLSALDYIRFLKGDIDRVDLIERDSPGLDAGLGPAEQEWAELPVYPLTQSFRLPQPVASLLTDLFYRHDDIELEGVARDPIPAVEAASDPVTELLASDEWVSVIIHDGEDDRRSSDIEAAVAEQLVAPFDVVEPDDEDLEAGKISAGVVVPFGDQRDRLQQTFDDAVQAETVEKFQGGERDLIVTSMVASDPGYVNMISEFLLSPYRFNVAASRMKRKLVVVASESVFQTSHPDANAYEDQVAWKRLYQLTGALDEETRPAASGSVREIESTLPDDVTYEVYHADLDGI